jgi:hypothetical protein
MERKDGNGSQQLLELLSFQEAFSHSSTSASIVCFFTTIW